MAKQEKSAEQTLASIWNFKFKEAMVTKAPITKEWNTYQDAYRGDYFKNKNLPAYKSNAVSNYIFSIVETIRPIMLDNDPKFQTIPRQPTGMAFSTDLTEALSYEWDRENMNVKLYRELINTLVIGNAIFFIPWNKEDKNVNAIPVNPYNIFPDPLATTMDDAEYIIYATYKNESVLKRLFPAKASKLNGGNINYSELVYDNNKNANVNNQILVLEVWTRDYEVEESGKKDGTKVLRYPKGRVITLCPEIGVVLSDKANPYKDGKFPFTHLKDYDIPGKFWGEGEVAQLISPQTQMNELNNAILDNAKATANMPWIVDKSAGIGKGQITSRPGLIIRKNQGSEVRREQAPQMPGYVGQAVETFKADMEQVSGIFDTLKGNSETGVYTAQGVLALQEAGQARIRLKVKLMEDALGKMASMWFSRMQQFWSEDKFIRMTKMDGTYDFKKFQKGTLGEDYDFRIMAGSTMPVNRGAMLDLMIRLAQTQMPDGQGLVDREAVANYLPAEIKGAMMGRMEGQAQAVEQQIAQLEEALQQLMQQFEQLAQETQQNDEQSMSVIEDIAGAIEKINQQLGQVKQESDKLKQEQQMKDAENKLKTDSYNSGYTDAEKILSTPNSMEGEGIGDELGMDSDMGLGLPDDIMQSLETMTDDELAVLLASNPELADLIK